MFFCLFFLTIFFWLVCLTIFLTIFWGVIIFLPYFPYFLSSLATRVTCFLLSSAGRIPEHWILTSELVNESWSGQFSLKKYDWWYFTYGLINYSDQLQFEAEILQLRQSMNRLLSLGFMHYRLRGRRVKKGKKFFYLLPTFHVIMLKLIFIFYKYFPCNVNNMAINSYMIIKDCPSSKTHTWNVCLRVTYLVKKIVVWVKRPL